MSVQAPQTLEGSLTMQEQQNILCPPVDTMSGGPADTPSTTQIALVNQSSSSNCWAYMTGMASDNDNAVWMLEADGSYYYPSAPPAIGTPVSADVAIPLGAPGTTTTVTVPHLAGARIWFSQDQELTFLLNPTDTGTAALVLPSVTNPSDPNYNIVWDFCEFTYDTSQLFANITYVDFVSVPISLTLLNTSGTTTHVAGLPSDGLDTICNNLVAQSNSDGSSWSSLIITDGNGNNLRALSPNSGISLDSSLFNGYYSSYVNDVWNYYESNTLTIDSTYGTYEGTVQNGLLTFPGLTTYEQPSAADIFNCSSGVFSVTTGTIGDVNARLTAAFNRSTLLIDTNQPDGEVPSTYYTNSTTNEYSRIVHAANLDGLGYAFPYDDVSANDSDNQSGSVNDSSPSLLTVTFGGNDAYSKVKARKVPQPRAGPAQAGPLSRYSRHQRRLQNAGQIKMPRTHMKRSVPVFRTPEIKPKPAHVDLELGMDAASEKQQLMQAWTPELQVAQKKFPVLVQKVLDSRFLATLRAAAEDPRIRPVINVINSILAGVLSLTMRAFLSRLFVVFFVVIFYVFVELKQAGSNQFVPVAAGNGTAPAL